MRALAGACVASAVAACSLDWEMPWPGAQPDADDSDAAQAGATGDAAAGPQDAAPDAVDASADAGSPPQAMDEPNQLVGIHFWNASAQASMGAGKYYDVEAYSMEGIDPAGIAAAVQTREQGGARVILRLDYQWGHSVPVGLQAVASYAQTLVSVARAIDQTGSKSHHYVLGNESNLPTEGGASPDDVGAAYAAAHAALASAGPWKRTPVLLTTPPSIAAEYGGGDGSYLRASLAAIKARGANIDAIALHSYDNYSGGPPVPGSADLFMGVLNMEAQAVLDSGYGGTPLLVTEMNILIGVAGDSAGAAFVNNAYSRLAAWNAGGEGNPAPGKLAVATGCWFVWDAAGQWQDFAVPRWSKTLAAFEAAAAAGYPSAWPK